MRQTSLAHHKAHARRIVSVVPRIFFLLYSIEATDIVINHGCILEGDVMKDGKLHVGKEENK